MAAPRPPSLYVSCVTRLGILTSQHHPSPSQPRENITHTAPRLTGRHTAFKAGNHGRKETINILKLDNFKCNLNLIFNLKKIYILIQLI